VSAVRIATAGAPGRVGESIIAAWTVAGTLVALVFSIGPVEDAVRSAPWLMGPALWIATAVGAGVLLSRLPGRRYPAATIAVATIAGAAADGLVVAGGHPWPGLVVGVVVYALAMGLLVGGPGARAAGTPLSAASIKHR
jgi:hypothetical protein